jgi:hypothetical protein
VDLGLVSVDSATARAHHHAAGMVLDPEQLAALEAAAEAEKGALKRNKSRKTQTTKANGQPGGVRSADGIGTA